MDKIEDNFLLQDCQSLTYGLLRSIRHQLRQGSLCIIPSDTCYSIAGLPFTYGVIEKISNFIPEIIFKEIPLTFASLSMVEKWVYLTSKDLRVIDEKLPGPVTLICKIKDEILAPTIEKFIHTKGTIGVRIPNSAIERQISEFVDMPITTCAIRNDKGLIIQKYDELINVLLERTKNIKFKEKIFIISSKNFIYQSNSTIATFQSSYKPYELIIIRHGEIDPKDLKKASEDYYSQSDIEDFT